MVGKEYSARPVYGAKMGYIEYVYGADREGFVSEGFVWDRSVVDSGCRWVPAPAGGRTQLLFGQSGRPQIANTCHGRTWTQNSANPAPRRVGRPRGP